MKFEIKQMKKIILLSFTLLFATMSVAQIDRSKAPAAGPAPKIQLGEYESFTLDNGLQVFLVENHKTAKVSYQLFVNHDVVAEVENAGMQSMMGSLLMTGTTSKNKSEIDETVDFIGASLNTSSTGAYASAISKHKETILSLMSDVILNPTFPQEELEKFKKQTINGLLANASDPGAISSNVSSVLKYGKQFPYGEVETKETVESITIDMCKEFYTSYFKPNISYLIIVGDISKSEAQPLVEKYFGSWVKGEAPKHIYPTPVAPIQTKVAFVDKPGAVQSTISIVYPVNLTPGSDEAIKASVMNAILGNSGFMARLIQNIREDKAYTYGAYSSLSSDPLVGSFYAGAEVRNEVTDSAIVEFLYEMKRLTTEKVSDEDLQNTKNYLNGGFARSLERPQTVARFALNTARYGLPADYYATYLEKLQAVTADDVMAMAKKYLTADNAYILVVGNKDEVANKLKGFSADGNIDYYDAYGNPVSDAEPIPSGVTPEIVLDNFFKAVGSKETIAKINSQDITMATSMQGMPITIRLVSSGKDKLSMTIKSGEMLIQQITVNGTKGKMSGMMGAKDLTEDQISDYLSSTSVVDEMDFTNKTLKLIQIEEINGTRAYKMEVSDENGSEFHYYDVASGFKVATVDSQDTPQGAMVNTSLFSDYKDANGIKVPFTTVEDNAGQVMEMKIEKIQLGGEVDSSNFTM